MSPGFDVTKRQQRATFDRLTLSIKCRNQSKALMPIKIHPTIPILGWLMVFAMLAIAALALRPCWIGNFGAWLAVG